MFDVMAAVRREMTVARAQLDAAKAAIAAGGERTSAELLNMIERKEYHRGRVDMAALVLNTIAREMRRDAADSAWQRANAG